jgi:phosphohistidine swiveling domain-containing protein
VQPQTRRTKVHPDWRRAKFFSMSRSKRAAAAVLAGLIAFASTLSIRFQEAFSNAQHAVLAVERSVASELAHIGLRTVEPTLIEVAVAGAFGTPSRIVSLAANSGSVSGVEASVSVHRALAV